MVRRTENSKNNLASLDISKFQAVIFDMDGVLIDSEPLWKIAMEKVFNALGSNLKKEDFELTVGLRIDEVIHFWNIHEKWNLDDEKTIEKKIIDELVQLILKHGKPLIGVLETLRFLNQKNIKIGLATSSSFKLVEVVLKKLNISSFFNQVHSAEIEQYGKPHPAVYLSIAKFMDVDNRKCLVIEDSLNGMLSALSAQMKVVTIPEKSHIQNPKLKLADYSFETMLDFYNALKR